MALSSIGQENWFSASKAGFDSLKRHQHILVAEAADASGSDPVHCRFESCRGYQYTFVAEMAYATD